MEEPRKLNDAPVDQPFPATAKNISVTTGALIILAAIAIVGMGIFYFFQADSPGSFDSNSIAPEKSSKSKAEITDTKKDETDVPDQVEEENAEMAEGADFDFDYELKKLDDQNNSVNPNDFDENEMSDANVGL